MITTFRNIALSVQRLDTEIPIVRPVWQAVHVRFECSIPESVLVESATAVNEVVERDFRFGYFFVRYFDQMPELRMRMSNVPVKNGGEVHDLATLLQRTIKRLASPVIDYRCIVYEPEVQRYGGPNCLPYAELCFFASSECVRNALQLHPSGYTELIIISIVIQYIFIATWFPDKAERGRYIDAENASGHLDSMGKNRYDDVRAHATETWHRAGPAMFFSIQKVFDAGRSHEANLGWLYVWRECVALLSGKIKRQLGSDQIDARRHHTLVSSLLHMTANRLGLSRSDELFVIYSLREVESRLQLVSRRS